MEKSSDPYMAIIRATGPLPYPGLISARLKTDIQQPRKALTPEWLHLFEFRKKEREWKEKHKSDYDKRHRAKNLTPLPDDHDQSVWVQTRNGKIAGRVIQPAATPRSCIVQIPTGQLHRNRSHLLPRPEGSQIYTSESDSHDSPEGCILQNHNT